MKTATKRMTTAVAVATIAAAILTAACLQPADTPVNDAMPAAEQQTDSEVQPVENQTALAAASAAQQATPATGSQNNQRKGGLDPGSTKPAAPSTTSPHTAEGTVPPRSTKGMADAVQAQGQMPNAMADALRTPRSGFPQHSALSKGKMNPQGMKPTPVAIRAQHHGTNAFYDTDEDNLSTFSLDADTASYDIAVDAIRNGHVIRDEMVRVEDFINAVPQGYERDKAISLHLDGAASTYNEDNHHIIRVGVAPPSTTGPRPPTSVIFVIDTSGSMLGAPMATSARVAAAIGQQLDDDDRTTVVGYGNRTVTTHMETRPFPGAQELKELFMELEASGSTPLAQAVINAYEIAAQEAYRDDVQQVAMVLISDGYGNVGPWEFEQIQDTIRQPNATPITLNTIAVVEQHFDDAMMEALANNGNGSYQYVSTGQDLDEFSENGAANIIRTGPRDARIQVEFNPEVVRKYRLIGYENRRVADQDFRNDALDFGEPGFQREATALYEIRLHEDPSNADATVLTARLRWRPAQSDTHREKESSLTLEQLTADTREPDQHLTRTMAMAEFAEILRGSPWADCRHTEIALQNLQASASMTGATPDLMQNLDRLPADWDASCTRQ